MRKTMFLKKNCLVVLMFLVPVCIVILKRQELTENGYMFGAFSSNNNLESRRSYWETCALGNVSETFKRYKLRKRTTTPKLLDVSETEEDLFVSFAQIKRSSNNIFFVESKCGTQKLAASVKTDDFLLNPRQCCAIESTARTNPDRDIYVLHTCPLRPGFLQKAPHYARRILRRHNVRLVRYIMADLFKDTPVMGLVQRRGLENSTYPVEHASDVIRLTLLWRFGGVYLDTDVITTRPLAELGTNFCGMESDSVINNAVLAFDPDGIAHELLTSALKHINDHFDGTRWTANGPDLITKLILDGCNATVETLTKCKEFSVYNHTILYPVHWKDSDDFFNPDLGPALVMCIIKKSFVVHTWNKITSKSVVQVGSEQAYGLMADLFCPDVYKNCGDTF